MKKDFGTLSPKQQRFCDEYLIDLNATQAAIRAGYAPGSAEVTGCRLLSNAKVKGAVSALQAKRADATGVDADYVLSRLYAESMADLADIYDDAGALLPVKKWPDIWRTGLVTSIDINEKIQGGHVIGHVCRIRLRDRSRVLELLGKHIQVQAFRESVQFSSMNGLGDRLERVKRRIST